VTEAQDVNNLPKVVTWDIRTGVKPMTSQSLVWCSTRGDTASPYILCTQQIHWQWHTCVSSCLTTQTEKIHQLSCWHVWHPSVQRQTLCPRPSQWLPDSPWLHLLPAPAICSIS